MVQSLISKEKRLALFELVYLLSDSSICDEQVNIQELLMLSLINITWILLPALNQLLYIL